MSTGGGEGLRLGQDGAVGVVRLDRPPVNALTLDVLERLAEVISRPEDRFGNVRALVLAAEGPHFSGGMDRAELAVLDRDRLARASAALAGIVDGPLPLVAAVHGSAAGTGFLLAASADLLVVDTAATVWLPEVELGMLGGAGHARRCLPMPVVRRMVLDGERIPGTVLHQFGALGVPDGTTAVEVAMAVARRLAGKDPEVVARARRILAELEADAAATHRREMETTPIPRITTSETESE